jgi:hypothetical protein
MDKSLILNAVLSQYYKIDTTDTHITTTAGNLFILFAQYNVRNSITWRALDDRQVMLHYFVSPSPLLGQIVWLI